MDQLLKEHDRLQSRANLEKVLDDVQSIIDHLQQTKRNFPSDPGAAAGLLETQYKSATVQFDKVNNDLKDIYNGLGKYSKALDKKFKDRPLAFTEQDALAKHTTLTNRAIAMHLLREGHFDVAALFMREANASTTSLSAPIVVDPTNEAAENHLELVNQLSRHSPGTDQVFSQAVKNHQHNPLHQQFQEMYAILTSLRQGSDLAPAITWAHTHSAILETRGSNLEYDLCQLQFISLFMSKSPGPIGALNYARQVFHHFPARYAPQIQRLSGAFAFLPNLLGSPYGELFGSTREEMTSAAAAAFTSEFCALLCLSSASPLLTAVTAGCIALPTLQKLSQIQALHRTSWTTASELPVEVPLPPAYKFHSIFVCPVSKEQSTDANPPMMMPCLHVICKDSLDRVSRGGRFKCPYCPAESHKNDAKRVFV